MKFSLTVGMAALVALGGCATPQDALDPYLGQDIQSVVARIGNPTQERTVLDQTLYIWSHSIEQPIYSAPDTSTTSTIVGPGIVDFQTTQTISAPPANPTYETLWCNIEVAVDSNQRITRLQVFDSSALACDDYFMALQ